MWHNQDRAFTETNKTPSWEGGSPVHAPPEISLSVELCLSICLLRCFWSSKLWGAVMTNEHFLSTSHDGDSANMLMTCALGQISQVNSQITQHSQMLDVIKKINNADGQITVYVICCGWLKARAVNKITSNLLIPNFPSYHQMKKSNQCFDCGHLLSWYEPSVFMESLEGYVGDGTTLCHHIARLI